MAKVVELADMKRKPKRKIIIKRKKSTAPAVTGTADSVLKALNVDTSKYVSIEGAITDVEATDYTKMALYEYGSYVVQDRAIPDYRDGLKPSHRAIMWAALTLGLTYSASVKKAARTVGDAIGKYHPHGDIACYGAMVTMANTAIPGIHGQGNWGSPLTNPAAMRYTEGKLSKFSTMFLTDKKYMAVTPMVPNFSEDAQQPLYLPALLPTILLFGNPTVPAYGVRAGNPTFSFKSVLKVTLDMLRGKVYDARKLAKTLEVRYSYGNHVISSDEEQYELISTGRGRTVTRPQIEASWDEKRIYIKSFCPGGNGGTFDNAKGVAKQLERITALPQVSSASAENSTRNKNSGPFGAYYIIVPTRGISEDGFWALAEKLEDMLVFKPTYALGITARSPIKGKTKFFYVDYMNLMEQWIKYRVKLESNLIAKQIEDAQHDLDIQLGYQRVCTSEADLQQCIKLIRTTEDSKLVATLMKAFDLSEIQAKAVLALQLRRLGKLALTEVKQEIARLRALLKQLNTESKNPALRAAEDLDARAKAYLKNPDEKVQQHMLD